MVKWWFGAIWKLQEGVDEFNKKFASQGGKAQVQRYEADIEHLSDDDNEEDEIKQPKKKSQSWSGKYHTYSVYVPPLMAHVHETVCQAGEIIFCDCTSSLDCFKSALSVLSTAHCASGMPLGVILSSDEREETLFKGLDMLKSILPEKAFFGREVHQPVPKS